MATIPWSNGAGVSRDAGSALAFVADAAADRGQVLDATVAGHPISSVEDRSGVIPYAVPGTEDIVELDERSFGPDFSGSGYVEGLRRRDKAREEYQKFISTDEGKEWLRQQEFHRGLPPDHPALVDGPINMVWPEMWVADALAAKGLVQLGARGAANGLRWASRGSWFGPRAAEEMISVGGKMVPASKAGYVEFGPASVPGSRVVKHMWGAEDSGSRIGRIAAAQRQRVAARKNLRDIRADAGGRGLSAAEESAAQKVPAALEEYEKWSRLQYLEKTRGLAEGPRLPGTDPLPLEGPPVAGAAQKHMAEAAKVLEAQQVNLEKAAEVLDKAAPEIAEQSKKAMAQVADATAELKALNGTPWWKAVRLNQNSHIWRFGEAKKTADPLLSPSTGGGLNYLNFLTGRGVPPRAVSGLMRGIGRELLPFEFDTASRLGAVMHWLTSPNAVSAAMTFVAGKRMARWAGEKLGWISPASESKLVQENNARAVVPAHDVPMTTPASAGSAPQAAPTTDQVVDRVSMDFIRRKYASMAGYDRVAAAAERDRLLASLPDEVRQSAVDDVRERVFKMHHPGASYRALRAGGDKNKAVLDRFDADVFGTRSENDWLTEDLNAYQRGLNMKQYGGEF